MVCMHAILGSDNIVLGLEISDPLGLGLEVRIRIRVRVRVGVDIIHHVCKLILSLQYDSHNIHRLGLNIYHFFPTRIDV
jgi:hypothetical protein